MKEQKLLKAGIVVMATAMSIISLGFNSKVKANTNCKRVDDSKVKYVNATFVDINPEFYNAQMRGMTSEEYYPNSVPVRSEWDKKYMLFGSTEGRMVGGIQNGFTGANIRSNCHGVLQGLAKDKLVNGNLVISDRFTNGTTLFPTSGETGWGHPYDQILLNWKMPFYKEDNGYYSYNSEKYHIARDDANKRFVLHEGERSGFYPFNNCNDDTSVEANRNLYFTAKMDIPFLMTSDGKVKNSTTGQYEDMIFNFSGDDDVWVYVDDQLVVDLGGLHIKQTGNINFAKNEVFYSCIYNEGSNADSYNVTKAAFNSGRLSPGNHTLKVFYMERAGGESNLFVSFNLQSSGVKTRYVEKYTGKELASTIKTGPVGDTITLEDKEFEDKVLCEKPKNTTIKLKEELQTYTYYYKNKYKVTADYIDKGSNQKIAESEITKVTEDDKYTTNSKTIKNYKLIQEPSNKNGIMPHNDINVKYYYKYSNCKVKVNYIDKLTGHILDTANLTGVEGEEVKPEEKSFSDYVLSERPTIKTTFNKKEQEINYYYKHKGKITVNYIDKANGKNLDTAVKNGIEGDKVKTEKKTFKDYILFKEPETNEYIISREHKEVNYYYIHQSKVIVNYIDKDTNETLERKEEKVTEGTVYETKEKEFENYKLVEKPKAEGVLIGKGNVEVNYYYRKLKFNLKVDMNLVKADINGNYYELKKKIGKIETPIKEANGNSTGKIYYKIKVKNNEERYGDGVLVDYLPNGYEALQEENQSWTITADRIYIDIDNIAPGEEREYDLVLTKRQGIDICGNVRNTVKVESKGVPETTLKDNEDKNDVAIMPRTGVRAVARVASGTLTALTLSYIVLRKIKSNKNKEEDK